MISGNQVKKLLLMACFVIIAIYTGLPRIQSVSNGLPYHHFWDEPATATGALIAVKTNKLIPKNGFELERKINILSGLLPVKINQSGVGVISPKLSPLWGTVKISSK